jgi:hypothetical protein
MSFCSNATAQEFGGGPHSDWPHAEKPLRRIYRPAEFTRWLSREAAPSPRGDLRAGLRDWQGVELRARLFRRGPGLAYGRPPAQRLTGQPPVHEVGVQQTHPDTSPRGQAKIGTCRSAGEQAEVNLAR